MRTLRALAVGALLFLGVAACGSSTTVSSSTDSGGTSTGAGGPYPRVIHHAMGDTEIKSEPKRVLALDQSFVDAVLTLGTEVIGYTTYRSIEGGLPSYLAPVMAKAKNAVSVGTLQAPSLEKIAALKPDLIVSAKVRHEALYGRLSQIAPTVFSETTGAIWKDNLRLVGRALGKEALAEQKIADYQARAAKIGEEIKAKNGGTPPTISIVRFAGEPTARLYVEKSYSGIVLKDAGFVRPEGQPTVSDAIAVDLSEERIPEMDADHIFVSAYDDPAAAAAPVKQKFEANPLWNRLKGEKHEVSDTTWMTAVGIQGAHAILDDLAMIFGVALTRSP
ncbi:iron-siderophore ABC transporter substrate-binding protein [Planotetraspora sp. A-T 1434]|uniref:ABC transporter substrate-binding protein n=1 Tax=Planotetraspora sp. A-T 1434 TaxID=2979219 RepID=UPI0021C1DD5E|nr:iron-siderophore ABC transporter substrate-binding protein [Planotetraspora sp. A-T 1434]MCT9933541.1 iron-siderophore ABC transporter substrate-binding protein [Planotetraspora sp. A-T 1434]